jgi:hypothetical protein
MPAQPKLNDVLRLIARLGGFLARKRDGEPGTETMRLLRDDGGNETCV